MIIPAYIYQGEDEKFHIKFFKTLDPLNSSLEELTKYQAKTCEEMIQFKPDEYFSFIVVLQAMMKNFTKISNES